jgi:hypothetical protein
MATALPQGYRPLEATIAGVTYTGSYWVDDQHHVVNVFCDFGNNSTPALGTHHPQHVRDEANESAASGLFRAMISGHLQNYTAP